MKKLILIGMCILLLLFVGCSGDSSTASSCEACADYNDVFVKINLPIEQTGNVVWCRSIFSNESVKFNHTWFYALNDLTDYTKKGNSIYRIKYPYLEVGKDIFSNSYFTSFLKNISNDDVRCRSDLITSQNNITAEFWDEGSQEVRKINLWRRLNFDCYKKFSEYMDVRDWTCRFEYGNTDTMRLGWHFTGYLTDEIFEQVLR